MTPTKTDAPGGAYSIFSFFDQFDCDKEEQRKLIQHLAAYRMRKTLELLNIPFRKKKNEKRT